MYITVEFEADPMKGVYHHMSIILCGESASHEAVWDCGEAWFGNRQPDLPAAGECKPMPNDKLGHWSGPYSWSQYSEAGRWLRFPPGIGFQIGSGTGYNAILLKTHFPELKELSGRQGWSGGSSIRIKIVRGSDVKMKKAGILNLTAVSKVPALTAMTITGSFPWNEQVTIHPFAYKPHGHTMTQSFNLSVASPNGQGYVLWQGNVPHQYHRLDHPDTNVITTGDRIDYGCTVINNSTHEVDVK